MIYVSFCFQVPLSGTAVMVLLCILFLSIRRKAVLLKIIMYVYTHAFFWTALIHSVIYYSHMSNSLLLLFYSPVSQDWSRNNSPLVLSLNLCFLVARGGWGSLSRDYPIGFQVDSVALCCFINIPRGSFLPYASVASFLGYFRSGDSK